MADAFVDSQASDIDPTVRELRARLATLEEEHRATLKTFGLLDTYRVEAGLAPSWTKEATSRANHGKRRKSGKIEDSLGIALMQLSDTHFDEPVQLAEMNEINAYNRPIASMRLREWSIGGCKLGEWHRHKWAGAYVILGVTWCPAPSTPN